jgi:hypothetical protein
VKATLICAALAAALTAAAPAAAKDQPLARASFTARSAAEAKLALTASAPAADWGAAGRESAVLSVALDGREVASIVTFNGATPLTYRVALGRVRAGHHAVTVSLDRAKSPVDRAEVSAARPSLAPAGDLVARYAPILYGRNLPEIPGAYENNHTDVPLLAYHTTAADAQGNRTIEYTTIWSNEDGGTNTPALMARWGRTTDIEWIYRVTVDRDGNRVSDAYQAANHVTKAFDGAREDDHPLLQTATANNNTAAVTDPATASGYRFFLDTAEALPAGAAREQVMDANPWSYQVMAKEMIREGKVEPVASPDTPEMSDQRDYLFAVLKKTTAYAAAPAAGSWAGTALAVKLKGSDRWYTSHHGVPDWSLQRDVPAATTVELPPGTRATDVVAVKAIAVPVGLPGDYRITVTGINRGFFLGQDFLPQRSFLQWTGSAALTPQQPEAVLWTAA